MISAPQGRTKPEAGVTATRPATAPLAAPRVVGFPPLIHSATAHEKVAAAAATCVATKAEAARPLAARADPPLKPNHPNQSNPAPSTVSVRLWGGIGSRGQPRRRPRTMAATR